MRYSKEIDRFSFINRRNIHNRDYTKTLISEALRVNLMSLSDIDDIQMQIMGQLERLLQDARENGATVGEEESRAMLGDIFFTLDTYLLSFHDPMYALSALQSESTAEMYRTGMRQLTAHYLETVNLYVRCRSMSVSPDCAAYRAAMDCDIHDALSVCRPRCASNTPPPFAYPVADPHVCEHRGIFYIKYYLKALIMENRFLQLFDPVALQRAELSAADGESIFLRVLHCALACAMLGRLPGTLILTEEQYERLCAKLEPRSTREVNSLLLLAVDALLRDLGPLDPQLCVYLRLCTKRFLPKLMLLRGKGELDTVFTVAGGDGWDEGLIS